MPRQFDHEKLDVYHAAIDFVVWVGHLLEGPLAGCRISAVKQLDRASTSIPLNIAEGNGKQSANDRCRYLGIARGSALECAACLDALIARGALPAHRTADGKALLQRIVEMLCKLAARLQAPSRSNRTNPSTSTSTSTSTKRPPHSLSTGR